MGATKSPVLSGVGSGMLGGFKFTFDDLAAGIENLGLLLVDGRQGFWLQQEVGADSFYI